MSKASYAELHAHALDRFVGFRRDSALVAVIATLAEELVHQLLIGLIAFGLAMPAFGAMFQPTRFDDPTPDACLASDCSLREAVIAANATPAHDSIVLRAGDYLLQRLCSTDTPECGDLDVTTSIEIAGAGSTLTFVSNTTQPLSNGAVVFESRVLDAQSASLALAALTLRDGIGHSAFFAAVPGGCLRANSSSLQMKGVTMRGCYSASDGGAVHLRSTQAVWEDVQITDNKAGYGGGVALSYGSTLSGSKVRIEDNLAYGGGGLIAYTGINQLRLAHKSVIAHNAAMQSVVDRNGGGVLVAQASTLIVDSNGDVASEWLRIEANEAAGDGGGLAVRATGVLEVAQVRVVGNLALGVGGGVSARGVLRIMHSEVASNVAEGDGGAFALPGDGDTGSRIERVSMHANLARGNGGGIASSSPRVWMENVSSYGNRALGVGGGFYLSAPPLGFRFNTSLSDVGASDSALHAVASVDALANVFAGKCTGAGVISNLGYNRRVPAATGCPGSVVFPVQMGLAFSDWGGAYRVVGFGPSSSLANVVPSGAGAPGRDAREFVRVGPTHDVGAFERDAVP